MTLAWSQLHIMRHTPSRPLDHRGVLLPECNGDVALAQSGDVL
eukprot:COSAG04_NODE_10639_length_762_cov_0.702866_1_plen_42_part_10